MRILRGEGSEILPVQGMLGHTGERVPPGADLLEILHLAAYAVLRAEERGERDAFGLVQEIGKVAQLGIDAGGVQDRAHPQAAQQARLEQPRDAQLDHQ